MKPRPPQWASKLLSLWADPDAAEETQGDLLEMYAYWERTQGQRKADWRYILNVLKLLRPLAKTKRPEKYPETSLSSHDMISNYFKIALRSLLKNKGYSAINIFGLATGMAVAIMIGLWIHDELSFNKSYKNYDRIAQVMQHSLSNGTYGTINALPVPLATELRTAYGNDFKYVVLSSWTEGHTLSFGDKNLWETGNYIGPQAPDLFSLKILQGSKDGLKDTYSIMLSESAAKGLFGDTNPLDKIVRIDNQISVKVTAVYEDLPFNTQFSNMEYLAPWDLNVAIRDWVKNSENNWENNSFQIFTQTSDQVPAGEAYMEKISAKIKDIKIGKVSAETARQKPAVFLQPMSRWHLYSEFRNGVNAGGRIQFVWLFGIIGVFVLLLACINFMNLSTARSEKRAKEVGIRKAIGSVKGQLIGQFLSEPLLIVGIATVISLLFVWLILPQFNEVADKKMVILWSNPMFWLLILGAGIFTGLIAGSYPAFYLSSFQPVKVLKGTFRVGRFAAMPRKVLVVVQFTVSLTLIIGTIIVFRQIQFAKNRPIGYSRNGLLYAQTTTAEIHNHYDAVRNDLLKSGVAVEISESESPLTGIWHVNGGFSWAGKEPGQESDFAVIGVSPEFGKTVGWEFKAGRDFSRQFGMDSSGMVINQAAIKFMGLKGDPIGQIIREGDLTYHIIGVINDMVMTSPYEPVKQTLFYLSRGYGNFLNIKLNPNASASEATDKIGAIFKKYDPALPFNYKFADQEYARKFLAEERIGKLATFFAILAILISCLGLFGLASFIAEQRTKEIGIRKVLGASTRSLWQMLSKDFVVLVIISCLISIPIGWYFLHGWLQQYQYHTEISWWIFAVSAVGALAVTLLTVSYQAIRAALLDPVKSLRSE